MDLLLPKFSVQGPAWGERSHFPEKLPDVSLGRATSGWLSLLSEADCDGWIPWGKIASYCNFICI